MKQPTALFLSLTLSAQTAIADCTTDAMVVFDGSSSMSEIGFDTSLRTRIQEAREAISTVMPQVEQFRRIGLMTYGPGGSTSCSGVTLRFMPQPAAAARMMQEIDDLRPNGLTPLSAAVSTAAELLEYRSQPAAVVLITDGNETCGGRPCATGMALAANARDLTVHVIGFRVSVDFFAWNNPEQDPLSKTTVARCLADETGGTFVSTETVDELVAALRETIGCPLIGSFGSGAKATGHRLSQI